MGRSMKLLEQPYTTLLLASDVLPAMSKRQTPDCAQSRGLMLLILLIRKHFPQMADGFPSVLDAVGQ